MKYYTSDMHFGHTNIIKHCKRPFENAEEMNKEIIRRWNARVTKNDDVYILGDFCFDAKEFVKFCHKLNGVKHFVLGNHDPRNIRNVKIPNVIFHSDIHEVKDSTSDQKIVLCHYPIFEWNGYYRGRKHFHGHTHGTIGRSFKEGAYDVCIDLHDYEPKTYKEIVG